MSEDEQFVKAARMLFGSIDKTADALFVSHRTGRSWASGRDPIPQGVWRDLVGIIAKRQHDLNVLKDELWQHI